MGHIHKPSITQSGKMVYPGSPISFGFDEMGEHGMRVGEVTKQSLQTEFVKLDERQFEKRELSVNNLLTQEDLVETIENLELKRNHMYEIVLVGNRQFEMNPREILKLIPTPNILKIKDSTKMAYNIEEIAKENNLRGIFIREVIKKYQNGDYSEEQIQKAIELGLEAM